MNYDNIWQDMINALVAKEAKREIRKHLKTMFQKYGIERTEDRINEVYKYNDKLRELYLEQHKIILKYSL